LKLLIDGDILRYEIGFAAETGWRAIKEDDSLPPWDYVAKLLHLRLDGIHHEISKYQTVTHNPKIYITEGRTFRDDIAKVKPYKGHRKEAKPWHYANLTAYMRDVLEAEIVTGIEADDAMAIEQVNAPFSTTIICTRDKDLRQVPGWSYSWELGRQPSFGPEIITKEGDLQLSENHKKLSGTGLSFFYAQCLIGDVSDNIPGLPYCGPVRAFSLLKGKTPEQQLKALLREYKTLYGHKKYEKELREQGRLLWMVRSLYPNGQPVLWEIGMTE
jgi:5'-3' exonuclease